MLRSLILLPAFLIAASGGCSGSQEAAPEVQTAATGEPFVLAQGDATQVAGHALRFVDIVEDSRCPTGVTCVWEGRAKVRLAASGPSGETDHVLTLPYSGMTEEESDVWSVGGVVVRLLDVLPHPGDDDSAVREVELSVAAK